MLLVHGGTSSGGLLTTALMISFDLVIASGIFGAACYFFVPRLMTRIEREPLLVEDLEARREELRAELVRFEEQAGTAELGELDQRKVRRRFLGIRLSTPAVFSTRRSEHDARRGTERIS